MLRIPFLVMLLALLSPVASAAPDTRAKGQLILIGVVPGTGQALIWKATNEEYVLVRVGELCQGYQLRRLLKDRVILAKDATSLVLALDGSPLVGPGELRPETGGRPASMHTARGINRARTTAPRVEEVQPQEPPKRQKQQEQQEQRSLTFTAPPVAAPPPNASPAGELVSSPIKLGEGVQVISLLSLRKEVSSFMHGLSPYHVSFSPSGGLLVQGIKAGTLLHTLGLEDGDEILSIGGIQISSKEEALNAYLTFAPEREVELQLLRQGAPSTLSFRLST